MTNGNSSKKLNKSKHSPTTIQNICLNKNLPVINTMIKIKILMILVSMMIMFRIKNNKFLKKHLGRKLYEQRIINIYIFFYFKKIYYENVDLVNFTVIFCWLSLG